MLRCNFPRPLPLETRKRGPSLGRRQMIWLTPSCLRSRNERRRPRQQERGRRSLRNKGKLRGWRWRGWNGKSRLRAIWLSDLPQLQDPSRRRLRDLPPVQVNKALYSGATLTQDLGAATVQVSQCGPRSFTKDHPLPAPQHNACPGCLDKHHLVRVHLAPRRKALGLQGPG